MRRGFAFVDVAAIRRDTTLFENVSFAIAPGEAVLVTGPNGAGKSTLIRIAAGLLPPAAGIVTRGETGLALLAETSALDDALPLARALGFWAAIDGEPDAPGRVAQALTALDLDALATVPVRLLSTGQRRRAAMARVIASRAALWLLDEPANGLDSRAVTRLEAAIARHRAGGGMAIVATHLSIDLPHARTIMLGEAA